MTIAFTSVEYNMIFYQLKSYHQLCTRIIISLPHYKFQPPQVSTMTSIYIVCKNIFVTHSPDKECTVCDISV